MPKIDASEQTVERLAELQKTFGQRSIDATLTHVIDRFHTAYIGQAGELPDGWRLGNDLTLRHFEAYFEAYSAEDSGSAWAERGRVIRAAVAAGWFTAPEGLSNDDVARLKPAMAARVKNAIDAHYVKLVTADPNE